MSSDLHGPFDAVTEPWCHMKRYPETRSAGFARASEPLRASVPILRGFRLRSPYYRLLLI
jgi:hypothetical protein